MEKSRWSSGAASATGPNHPGFFLTFDSDSLQDSDLEIELMDGEKDRTKYTSMTYDDDTTNIEVSGPDNGVYHFSGAVAQVPTYDTRKAFDHSVRHQVRGSIVCANYGVQPDENLLKEILAN